MDHADDGTPADVEKVTPADEQGRKAPVLEGWSKTFSQDGDCWNSNDQLIVIEQHDGGGGPYWTLATQRWAIDSIDEIVALLREAGVEQTVPSDVPPA